VQEKNLYEYAIIRFLPRVEREEFLNVGVVLYCQNKNFLKCSYHLDPKRLTLFNPRAIDPQLEEHLRAISDICQATEDSGSIGQLPVKERFRWLTAPRSTIIQISPIHTGFCHDPEDALALLVEKLVKPSPPKG